MAKLPHVTSKVAPDLRQYLDRTREAFQALERRAAQLEAQAARATEATSISSGVLSPVLLGLGGVIDDALTEEYATPPAPTGLVVTGAFSTVILDWDVPTYRGHAYTEIWAHTSDVLGDAVMVGQTPGAVFSHNLGTSTSRYYWIRFVNVVDVAGPYNAVNGELGTTADDPEYLIGILAEEYGTGSAAPFFQIDTPTVINGVTIPAGTYMKQAFIADATINRAKIQDAAIDTAKIDDLAVTSAKISELDAGKITTGFLDADRIDTGALTADKIDTRNLNIKDGAGNIIFSSGVPLDFSRVVNAGAMADIDQITAGNLATYINSAVVLDAYIDQLTAGQIDTRGLSIKDGAGNIIFAAGTPLDNSNVAGLGTLATQNSVSYTSVTGTKPPTNATNGATFGTNISGQITPANVTTYIANAAIKTAQIDNLAVTSAKIGNLAVDTLQIAGSAVETDKILNGAVTARASTSDTSGSVTITGNAGSEADIMNPALYATIDTGIYPGDALVSFQFDFNKNAASEVHYFRLIRDPGANILDEWSLDDFQKDRKTGTISGSYIDTGRGTGEDEYYLQAWKATASVNCAYSNVKLLVATWVR